MGNDCWEKAAYEEIEGLAPLVTRLREVLLENGINVLDFSVTVGNGDPYVTFKIDQAGGQPSMMHIDLHLERWGMGIEDQTFAYLEELRQTYPQTFTLPHP